MLPFLKNKEGSVSMPVETQERKPDEPKEYGMLDAIWEDLLEAFHSKDKDRGVAALEALCAHIQDQDSEQDFQMMGE